MQKLLAPLPNSTFTIWSSEGDNVNITNLRYFIATIGIKKIFVDVPIDLQNQLRLDDLPVPTKLNPVSHEAFSGKTVGVTFSVVLMIFSVFLLIV